MCVLLLSKSLEQNAVVFIPSKVFDVLENGKFYSDRLTPLQQCNL